MPLKTWTSEPNLKGFYQGVYIPDPNPQESSVLLLEATLYPLMLRTHPDTNFWWRRPAQKEQFCCIEDEHFHGQVPNPPFADKYHMMIRFQGDTSSSARASAAAPHALSDSDSELPQLLGSSASEAGAAGFSSDNDNDRLSNDMELMAARILPLVTMEALDEDLVGRVSIWLGDEILASAQASSRFARAVEMSRHNLVIAGRQWYTFRVLKPSLVFLMVLDDIEDDMIGAMNELNTLHLPANASVPYKFWMVCPLWRRLLTHHGCTMKNA